MKFHLDFLMILSVSLYYLYLSKSFVLLSFIVNIIDFHRWSSSLWYSTMIGYGSSFDVLFYLCIFARKLFLESFISFLCFSHVPLYHLRFFIIYIWIYDLVFIVYVSNIEVTPSIINILGIYLVFYLNYRDVLFIEMCAYIDNIVVDMPCRQQLHVLCCCQFLEIQNLDDWLVNYICTIGDYRTITAVI